MRALRLLSLRRRGRRAAALLALVVTFALAGTGAALAYWATLGSGSGTAPVGTLHAPTGVIVPATSAGAVNVSWTASSGTPAPIGYYVIRIKTDNTTANACGTSPSSAISAVSCVDSVSTSGTYTYKVTAVYRTWTATSSASSAVFVTIATATKLAFTTQPPTTVTAATTFSVGVTVEDASGAAVQVAGQSVTVAIGTNPSGGTLGGTLTVATNASGVATFSNLTINKIGTGYKLGATSSGLASATSTAFNVTAGTAAALALTTQPSATATGGTAFGTQPVVTVQDAGGNTVASSASVTLAIKPPNNSGGTLTCTTNPVIASAGVATFAGCKIDKIGTYTLTASASGLTGAQSSSITVSVGAAAKLVFTTSPSNSTGGTAFPTQPVVALADAGGNLLSTGTNAITLSVAGSPAGVNLTCDANPKNAVSGSVTLTGCKINKVGTYALTASATGLTAATSSSFTISTGAAVGLCFVSTTDTTCLTSLTIVRNTAFTGRGQLVDAGNNPVTATTAISVALSTSGDLSNPSPLSVTISSGQSVSGNFSTTIANGANKLGTVRGQSAGLSDAVLTLTT